MNKRYIDFVPVERGGAVSSAAVRRQAIKKTVAKRPVVTEPSRSELPIIRKVEPATTFSRNIGGVSTRKSAEFGVIEDYHPKFVQAEVKKRPLGSKAASSVSVGPAVRTTNYRQRVAKTGVTVRSVGIRATTLKMSGARAANATSIVAAKKPVAMAPAGAVRANFINVGKIEKRPLSKNVYARKAPATTVQKEKAKEISKKPTVIIAKPEKDSKLGLIVAVILTIILGAAAGTVAFLLLPK